MPAKWRSGNSKFLNPHQALIQCHNKNNMSIKVFEIWINFGDVRSFNVTKAYHTVGNISSQKKNLLNNISQLYTSKCIACQSFYCTFNFSVAGSKISGYTKKFEKFWKSCMYSLGNASQFLRHWNFWYLFPKHLLMLIWKLASAGICKSQTLTTYITEEHLIKYVEYVMKNVQNN